MVETRIALVTDANQGIGLQVAKELVASDVTVYLGSRNLDRGVAAGEEIGAGAGEHIWTQATAEQDELLELTEPLIDRARLAGAIREDVTAMDIAMLMCGVSATMAYPTSGFDWRRHLELLIDTLRSRQSMPRPRPAGMG